MFQPKRAEHQLILDCARPKGYEQGASFPIDASTLDWHYVLDFASRHRIAPLLYYYLKASPQIQTPENVCQVLKKNAGEQALANLFQTQELLKIIEKLEEAGLDVMPFKGPVLGQFLYNNLGLRPFGDLDILIHKDAFPAVKQILLDNSYTPYRSFSPEEEQDFLDTQMGFEFVRKDEQSVFEVHWSFLNTVHAFKLPEADVWRESRTLELSGKQVRIFSPAHLLVYLCAHGSKSLWARLRWICDVAELAARHVDDEAFWQKVLALGKETNSRRMLLTGLKLAHVLLKTPLPPRVLQAIQSDYKVPVLANKVITSIFAPPGRPVSTINPVTFHLQMHERFLYRVPYYQHLFRLWSTPSSKDKDFVSLPRYLEFLYILIKPIRLILQKEN